MVISDEYKFIFIHIGKTGGTSIEKVLCSHLGIDFEQTKKDPEGNWWKHIWAKGMHKRIGKARWEEYFTFAFVRNPYDMMLSLYSMYTQYPEYTNREAHPDLYHPWNQYRDFPHFIKSIGRREHESDDKWRKQLDKLGAKTHMDVWNSLKNLQTSYLTESWMGRDGEGKVLVDFVGRYERLESDFAEACDRIGLPRLELITHGKTEHEPFYDLYDEEMQQVVYEHFSIDVERWGYGLVPA